MVSSKETMAKIKKIIEKRYKTLAISLLGRDAFTKEELKEMEKLGVDVSTRASLLELAYHHNFINPQGGEGPISTEDMKNQQSNATIKPRGPVHTYAEQHSNEMMKASIDKMKQDVITRLLSIVNDNNQNHKFDVLKNPGREENMEKRVKESTVFKLKQKLRDTSGDANRDWLRVAITEISNTIGAGSVDRIVKENPSKAADEIYVYRIVTNDAALCKYCRNFYQDSDDSPKVYRLSTLLANGSNYGKRAADWLPVTGATHPNERCSQVIEIKRGWKVLPGGKQTYIGSEKWNEYIVNKVVS